MLQLLCSANSTGSRPLCLYQQCSAQYDISSPVTERNLPKKKKVLAIYCISKYIALGSLVPLCGHMMSSFISLLGLQKKRER